MITGFLITIWFLELFFFEYTALMPLLIMGLCLAVWGFLDTVAPDPVDETGPKP
jgi:hydrogenase/urease accessory protein HupE